MPDWIDFRRMCLQPLMQLKWRPGDGERIRIMLLERVRIAYGMGFEEFSRLDDQTIQELIGDERLAGFALKRGPVPGPEELEGLLLEIQRWS